MITAIQNDDDTFTLTTVDTVKDVNDKDVQIPRIIGTGTLADYQSQLDDTQARIDAINECLNG